MSIARTSILLGLALTVSACGGTKNRGLETVHQPVIQRTDYVFDVAASGGLSSGEVQRLAGWMESLKLGYGDHVSVDASSASDTNTARDSVGALAARYGLLLDETAPVTTGEIAPGNIRIVVSRIKANVPGCPDWSRAAQPELGGHTSSNFGCASSSNLAAMVADPADLVSGRTGSPVSSTLSTSKAVKTYREAAPTGASGLQKEGTTKQ